MTAPKQWLGISGRARAGKTTAAEYLVERYGFVRIGFADALKEMALAIDPIVHVDRDEGGCEEWGLVAIVDWFGWDRAKDGFPEVRRFLQRLGTEGVRHHIGEDTWVQIAERKALAVDGPVVFDDVRFRNELEMVHRHGGANVHLWRPGHSDVAAEHASEEHVPWVADYCIDNTGTVKDLHRSFDGVAADLLSAPPVGPTDFDKGSR